MRFGAVKAFFATPDAAGKLALVADLKTSTRVEFLRAAIEIGILEHLRTPSTLDGLARGIAVGQVDLLRSFLDLGVSLGELNSKGNVYSLRGRRSRLLSDPTNDPYKALLLEAWKYHGPVYADLGRRLMGLAPGRYLESTGGLVARSSRTLEPFIAWYARKAVARRKPTRILEIGCGSGIYLKCAAESHGGISGLGVDIQEEAVRQTKDNLERWGLGKVFQVWKGDVRELPDDLRGPYDMITMYNNIYYFAENAREALFTMVREMLASDGMFVLVSTMSGSSSVSRAFDVVLRSTEGCFPLPELPVLVAQLAAAGFGAIRKDALLESSDLYGVRASTSRR